MDVASCPVHRSERWLRLKVAQENISIPEKAKPLEHAQVGAFFSRFDEDNCCYVPNAELRVRYPDDYCADDSDSELSATLTYDDLNEDESEDDKREDSRLVHPDMEE